MNNRFNNPIIFQESGETDHIDVDGLEQMENYYVRGFVQDDGEKVYSDNVLSFQTKANLPSQLQMVEYLESDYNSYIILNLIDVNHITDIKCRCRGYGGDYSIFGAEMNDGVALKLGSDIDNRYYFSYFSQQQVRSSQDSNDDVNFYYHYPGSAYFNEEEIENVFDRDGFGTVKMMLFGNNNYGNLEPYLHSRIYYFKTNNCILVPCYVRPGENIEDTNGRTRFAGDCGFYDVMNNNFYGNDGFGNFIPGEDVN